ncbi:hypothetical protein B0H10DRAFT_2051916, partial [Mycena sp. CBHHK59/15]
MLHRSLAALALQWATSGASIVIVFFTPTVGNASDFSHRAAAHLAVVLRRLAKFLATCNAAWIMAAFLMQFGNFYDRCYCNRMAHSVMVLENSDISAMNAAWIGGV